MPTIGWFEILIIVAIAIVVLGPKDFPIMLKKVGSWIGTIKNYINNVQNEVSNIDNAIFGTGKFYKEKQDGKKEDIYSNIDEMLSSTLDSEEKNKNS